MKTSEGSWKVTMNKVLSCSVAVIILLAASTTDAQNRQPNRNMQPQRGQNRQAPGQQQQDQMMQVVAIVNGQQISRQQLAHETVRRFGEKVIESVINKQLVLNELRNHNIQVTVQDVEAEIQRQAAKLKMSAQKYLEVIQSKRNISIPRIKNDVFWTEIALRRLAEGQTKVTEAEIAKQMETELGPKVLIRIIALDDATKAQQVHAAVTAKPQEFGQYAIQHSVDANSASRRGLLPPIRKHTGDPKLEQIAFSLKPGQVSQIIEFGDEQVNGGKKEFFILYCERKFPPAKLTQQQAASARDQIVEQIKTDKLKTVATQLFKRLQETVKIVNVYNDPNLSKANPGIAATVDGQPITMRYLREECIARYGVEILDSLISRTLLQQASQKVGQTVTDQDVQTEIARVAESFGWVKQGKVDMKGWLNFVTRGDESKITFYVEDEVYPTVTLRKLVAPTVKVSDEDMQKGFIANFGERVDVQMIVVNDHKLANKVWKMARDNPTEQFFGKLSGEYSSYAAVRNSSGEWNPIARYGEFPFLEQEAFNLKAGDISALVNHGKDWFIMRCKGRTKPTVSDFDAVKDMLRKDIYEKKLLIAMDQYFGRLQSSAQIDNFLTGTSQTGRELIENARNSNPSMSRQK